MLEYRPYQTYAINSFFDYFEQGKRGHPLIGMPTGTGKSVVNAGICARIIQQWPQQRILCLTHVQDLIEQNYSKLRNVWNNAPAGIYSAGLKRYDTALPIILGGVQSVVGNLADFGRRDVILVDEAHLIPTKADTSYQKVIAHFQALNPNLVVGGMTATPFRLGQGLLTDDGIFTDFCCDMTGVDAFNWFIREGYLAPLIPRPTKVERVSTQTILNSNGEFTAAALEADAADKEVTTQALVELCEYGQERDAWLAFASTIDDAEFIAYTLETWGISAAAVHSKMPREKASARIAQFKRGEIRCLVNKDMLTTGFDYPAIDLIAMLRRTMSPGLWVQMLGRGTRPSPGKDNCLVLDFAGNTKRLGPINDPRIPRKKGKSTGDAPVRICGECGVYNHAAARECIFCGTPFTFQTHLVKEASTHELIRTTEPQIEIYHVNSVYYYRHEKTGSSIPSIRVVYFCNQGAHRFEEYIHIERDGLPGKKARDWWRVRDPLGIIPADAREALMRTGELKIPAQIHVWVNKKHPEIVAHEF